VVILVTLVVENVKEPVPNSWARLGNGLGADSGDVARAMRNAG
jgi:hypothetical protein